MKKVIPLLIASVICLLSCFSPAFASDKSENPNIEVLAVELLSDALACNDGFSFPALKDQELYLCKPIHPQYLRNDTFVINQDIEYYLIKTDDTYIANITVCYDNGKFLSAAFGTDLAQSLVANNISCSDIALIPHDGVLYIKASDSVTSSVVSSSSQEVYSRSNSFVTQLRSKACDLSPIEHQSIIELPFTSPVIPRSSRTLNVPYVPQGDYNICWAAAAGALGQYHTGISHSATELCDLMGVPYEDNNMTAVRRLLSQIYGLSTTYKSGHLSANVIINRLNENKPIIVGFTNNTYAHMVVLCGFDYPSTTSYLKYYFRDSNYASLKIVVTYPTEEVIMDYYSDYGYLFWAEAVYKS